MLCWGRCAHVPWLLPHFPDAFMYPEQVQCYFDSSVHLHEGVQCPVSRPSRLSPSMCPSWRGAVVFAPMCCSRPRDTRRCAWQQKSGTFLLHPSRHWDNPAVLEKLSAAMGDAFNADGGDAGEEAGAGAPNGASLGPAGDGAEEEEEGDEEEPSVHSAAAAGAPGGRLLSSWAQRHSGEGPLHGVQGAVHAPCCACRGMSWAD